MIRLEHVTYFYPQSQTTALRDVDLEIADGSFVAMVGANGAGKSTLCHALAGFIPHHFRGELRGRVMVDELDTATIPLAQIVNRVGLVFQNPFSQLSGAKLTVAEEVAFGLENLGVPRDEMHRRVRDILELTRLISLAERSPYELSGGEMQRVALASILVMQPNVLVLDEPTAQLDPIGTRQVFDVIHTIRASRRATVVMVEHKPEWIAQLADRVIVLDDGKIILDGTPRAVLTAPQIEPLGIAVPRYTLAARRARETGVVPGNAQLPVTMEQALEYFDS